MINDWNRFSAHNCCSNLWNQMEWQKRSFILCASGYFPFGGKGYWKMLTGRMAFITCTDHIYKDYPNDKIVGTYGPFGGTQLVVRDLELAKNILIKDFDHFVDRRKVDISRKSNKYFLDMLLVMEGEKWKTMRNILSPVFTSGKLRNMMPIIHKVKNSIYGREPWSSGYGRQLMIERSWVWIPALNTGWTRHFLHCFVI